MSIFSPIGLNTHHKKELSVCGLGHKNACSKKILTKIEEALCYKLMTLLTLFTLLTWFTLLTLFTQLTLFTLLTLFILLTWLTLLT